MKFNLELPEMEGQHHLIFETYEEGKVKIDEYIYWSFTKNEDSQRLKIGGGTPPILTRHGWLIIYHGVSEIETPNKNEHNLCYSAGVMLLSKEHPQHIHYRSVEPVLTPMIIQECSGNINNVVFPTGIDQRIDIGLPDRFDIYYGMTDSRIGVARLDLPVILPKEGVADAPNAKV